MCQNIPKKLKMSTKQMLERLALYSGKVVKSLPDNKVFICKCRHSHVFRYTSLDEWCITCNEPKFQQELIHSMNKSLKELESIFHIFSVNKYGIGEIICHDGHIQKMDIDEIPNECHRCTSEDCSIRQVSHDMHVWKHFANNLNITHEDLDDSDTKDSIFRIPSSTNESEEYDDEYLTTPEEAEDDDEKECGELPPLQDMGSTTQEQHRNNLSMDMYLVNPQDGHIEETLQMVKTFEQSTL